MKPLAGAPSGYYKVCSAGCLSEQPRSETEVPIKIRCPHCQRVLAAEDQLAGQQRLCPACGGTFRVPTREGLPVVSPARPQGPTVPTCPRCRHEVAPLATYCRFCHTELQTGRPLPWKRRLRLLPWTTWLAIGLGATVLSIGIAATVQTYRVRVRSPRAAFTPTTARPVDGPALAAALLAAQTPAEREAALAAIRGCQSQVVPALVAGLVDACRQEADFGRQLSRIAALDLVAEQGRSSSAASEWVELLRQCPAGGRLHEAALRCRAMLGDAAALEDLAEVWRWRLERWLLLQRVVRVARSADQPGAKLALTQAATDVQRAAQGLQALAATPDNPVFEHLADIFWESWRWLGQDRGERYAEQLFALAGSGDVSFEFRPQQIRAARDTMRRVAERGTPSARAAAGLILEQCGPQYRSACRAIGDILSGLLRQVDARDQQRLTWALGRLHGRLFGPSSPACPEEVTVAEIRAAQQWARPDAPPTVHSAYPKPPQIQVRIVSSRRLLERDLLEQMNRDWVGASAALERWLEAGLGVTPRLRELLHPGQRQPAYPALASGLVIVAVAGDQSLRRELELWREAADQPEWLRALAYAVLGSLDARRGRWDSGWPADWSLGEEARLDAGQPPWEYFARVLLAGGAEVWSRLDETGTARLSGRQRAKLLEAARRVGGGGVSAPVP